jgi:hypothetical protein
VVVDLMVWDLDEKLRTLTTWPNARRYAVMSDVLRALELSGSGESAAVEQRLKRAKRRYPALKSMPPGVVAIPVSSPL